jgi:hypothetical protein
MSLAKKQHYKSSTISTWQHMRSAYGNTPELEICVKQRVQHNIHLRNKEQEMATQRADIVGLLEMFIATAGMRRWRRKGP